MRSFEIVRRFPRLVPFVVGVIVEGCSQPPAHRPIQMVPLPPPSASPEPPTAPEPEHATMPSTPGSPSTMPQPLAPVQSDAGAPAPQGGGLEGALQNTGWSVVGSVHTTQERGFEVTHAEIRKPGVRGHVRLVRGAGDDARMPHLPAGANPGVLVEADGMKGAESYFYDATEHTLGIVSLSAPGTRLEASAVLRACFPFVH